MSDRSEYADVRKLRSKIGKFRLGQVHATLVWPPRHAIRSREFCETRKSIEQSILEHFARVHKNDKAGDTFVRVKTVLKISLTTVSHSDDTPKRKPRDCSLSL